MNLGNPGRGPGEFGFITMLGVGPGGDVHVFDRQTGRMTAFSPTGDLLRSETVPLQLDGYGVLVRASGWVLVNAVRATPEGAGFPLLWLSPEGEVLRSLGSERPATTDWHYRALAPAGPGAFWSAHVDDYRIERWSDEGELERLLVREDPAFQQMDERRGDTAERGPPPSHILGIQEDRRGRLWVLSRVPDPAWEAHVRSDEPFQPVRYWDSRIDAIDLRTRRCVASLREGGLVTAFVGDGLVAIYEPDDLHRPRMRIVRFSLED